MDVLREKVAANCGCPVTGCTFGIKDNLKNVFTGTYGNEMTTNALVRKRPTI